MRAVPVLAALLPMAVLVCSGLERVHAQSEPQPIAPPLSKECQAPGIPVAGTTPLPNAERALRERKVLRILAIGSAPPRGMQRRGEHQREGYDCCASHFVGSFDGRRSHHSRCAARSMREARSMR